MSLKKTDMVKNLAKKLDGKMKNAGVPPRFAQGSAVVTAKRTSQAANAPAKLIPLSCRLPADVLGQVRERAVNHAGGINALVAEALSAWLESTKGRP